MKKILRIVFSLIALGVLVFLFQDPLRQAVLNLQNKYLPCSWPITYSLSSFDTKFGISKEEFLRIVNIAKEEWEQPISKELFVFAPNGDGDLKINLIYDIRQEASQKLKDIGITVNDTKASYDDLKERYNAMQADYLKLKAQFETRVASFQSRQNAYNQEVAYFNANGGAPQNDYDRLNREKDYLNAESGRLNNLQTELNFTVNNINALVVVLNRLANTLNIEVKKYNTIGSELGGEFEEGTYQDGPNGREIDIYQFDNKNKLARVLTHEFGHALGLLHLENPKAVMYRLNNGVNEKLTIDDILALKKRCGISSAF